MIKLICGPPCGGKSTYVNKYFRWGDLIIDYDRLYKCFGFQSKYEKPMQIKDFIHKIRDISLNESEKYDFNVWYIATAPKKEDREWFKQTYKSRVFLINPGFNECLRNLSKDKERSSKYEQWYNIIKKWFDNFTE